jgi:hypothetical protein
MTRLPLRQSCISQSGKSAQARPDWRTLTLGFGRSYYVRWMRPVHRLSRLARPQRTAERFDPMASVVKDCSMRPRRLFWLCSAG